LSRTCFNFELEAGAIFGIRGFASRGFVSDGYAFLLMRLCTSKCV